MRPETGRGERRGAQGVEKPRGGDHRAHRVRGRRADADLEEIEDRDEHERLFLPGPRRASQIETASRGRVSTRSAQHLRRRNRMFARAAAKGFLGRELELPNPPCTRSQRDIRCNPMNSVAISQRDRPPIRRATAGFSPTSARWSYLRCLRPVGPSKGARPIAECSELSTPETKPTVIQTSCCI